MSATDGRLLLLIERIERLMEERDGITADIRDVFAEGKAVGYDTRMMRALIARRAMEPGERAERDQMLAVYESAIGLAPSEDVPTIEDLRPDAAALAASLLTAEIVALEDPEQAAALVDHVLFLLDLRAEIALLRQQEGERKKLAKAEGFDAKQVGATVRWFEKCARHGEDAMRAGEQTFRLYRGTVEARPGQVGAVTQDEKLAAMLTPQRAAAPKRDKISDVLAQIAGSSAASGEG